MQPMPVEGPTGGRSAFVQWFTEKRCAISGAVVLVVVLVTLATQVQV